MIEVNNIGFEYEADHPIFKNVKFEIEKNQIITILGPNGAGKSTLLNCISNLSKATSGNVKLDGCDIQKIKPRELAKRIGYVRQMMSSALGYRVIDYLITGIAPQMSIFEKPKPEHYALTHDIIKRMKLEPYANRPLNELSGGERQQVAIARALVQNPTYILLDEPTAHLDYGNQIKILNLIEELASQGYGIIMTTHNPDHAFLLNSYVGILDNEGQFTFGMGREIIDEALLTNLYDSEIKVVTLSEFDRNVCITPNLRRKNNDE